MLQLRSCRLANYKSYLDESVLEFSPRVTYVLGANNSGKTTLLEAIQAPGNAPHRSPKTVPLIGDHPRVPFSSIRMSFSISGGGLREFLLSAPREFGVRGQQERTRQETFLNALLAEPELRFDVVSRERVYVASCSWFSREVQATEGITVARYRSRPEHGSFDYLGTIGDDASSSSDLGRLLYEDFRQRIFRFRAERSRALAGHAQPGLELTPAADNLVQVLDNLQGTPSRNRQYLEHVRRVLPEIHALGVSTTPGGSKEIRIWFFDGEREDLATPLEQAGSGVPNILALLYTITMSPRPRMIMIDEPSVFLHPGATRELIRVIREFSQHQYIISSHQPIALDELDDVAMVLLKRGPEGATSARSVDPARSEDQQAVLSTVGASLSDVFSADRILWVEGMTETKVFRTVAGRIGLPRGAAILPIVHTGDLEGTNATLAIEIYRRLTESGALVPPAIAIVLDDEGRADSVKEQLRSRLQGTRLEFLPFRMIENVFLRPELVHEFLRREEGKWGPSTVEYSATAVQTYWDSLRDTHRFKVDFRRAADPRRWMRDVHGARVLEDTLAHFCENRLAYDKVSHGPRLTKLAEELDPTWLEPIETLLRGIIAAQPVA